MPIQLGFRKVIQRITGNNKNIPVDVVAQRFLQTFLDHGVEAPQIPRLVSQIKLDDLQSPEKLLTALTPEILDQTAKLFGIRSQWLEGVDDEIYEYLYCYKRPELLLEHLASLLGGRNVGLSFPLRVLTTTKKLDFRDGSQQLLVPVLVEQFAELGDERIYRYHVYRDGFDWGESPTRIELKAIARIVDNLLHTPVPLFEVSNKEMQDILDGKLIPRRFLMGCQITRPSLEDFALTREESLVAKEIEEIPAVLKYIEDNNLQNFTFDRPQESPSSAQPPESPADSPQPDIQEKPKKSGKRAQAEAEVWEPARAFASALWSDPKELLDITEVINRIKNTPRLKASAFTPSAIRKRIVDLAPEGVRGKSGRKAKKPS